MNAPNHIATAAWERLRAAAAPPPPARLLVADGICGAAAGADEILAALQAEPAIRTRDVPVIAAGCDGRCAEAVVVTLQRDGGFVRRWTRVTPDQVGGIAAALDAPAAEPPSYPGQTRLLFQHAGAIDPVDIDEALRRGRYGALAAALDRRPEEVIAEVERSGLTGRGGAYFPTAIKWTACRSIEGVRFMVMNAEEGEPGVYKDRHLLEGDPRLACWKGC